MELIFNSKYNVSYLVNNKIILPLKTVKYMAKRSTTLSLKKKSRHSHKTRKRLEIKRLMLEKKATRKKIR